MTEVKKTSWVVEHGDWKTMQHPCERVRRMVFVAEQKVPLELEMDEADALCEHFVARDAHGMVVGCARLLPDGHIGRLAVLKPFRGRGVGSAVLDAVLKRAREKGFAEVALNAQTHARAFYERRGFEAFGDVFMEAGIEHVAMRLSLAG